MTPKTISVIGGLGYDLMMIASRIPDGGETLLANEYFEAVGGKGTNTAIATYRACHKKPPGFTESTESAPASEEDDSATTEDPPDDEDTVSDPYYGIEIEVKMIGAVGDDEYGGKFAPELERNGVDCAGVITAPDTATSLRFIMVENYLPENRCLFTMGAAAIWTREDFQDVENLGHGAQPDLCIAQMEIAKEVVEQMIETAGQAGIEFCLNASPAHHITYDTYQYITHFLVNESEAAVMTGRDLDEVNQDTWGEICKELLNRGVKNVVITLGDKGAYYANENGSGLCPAYGVDVVDTTGAGDTFTGVYAADYLRQKEAGEWDIRSAVIRANKAAALTITKFGAQQGVPWADEIDSFEAPCNDPDFATADGDM